MQHTCLLNFIRDELTRQGFRWKTQKELFHILAPDELWKRNRSNWSNWLKKPSEETLFEDEESSYKPAKITKANIKQSIAQTLFFDYSIWDASDYEQEKAVRKGVIKFIEQKNNPNKIIDLSDLIPKEAPITKEQEALFQEMKALSLDMIKIKLKEYPSFLEKKMQNQVFVLQLLTLFYQKGYYDLLIDHIFPALQPHKRDQEKKMIQAHALACTSTPNYLLSAKLLESVEVKDDLQLIDIKTSVVSNLRRLHFFNPTLKKEEFKHYLKTFIRHYHDIYTNNNTYHYYPAVNLLYMLKLAELIFPDDKELIVTGMNKILKETYPSIQKDKNSSTLDMQYYAGISELEIKMLTRDVEIFHEFGELIERLDPPVNLLRRTYRQVRMFLELVERFGDSASMKKLQAIKSVGKVFKDI